jgi:hypothetical protein
MYLSVGYDNVYYKNVDHVQQNLSNKNHVGSRRRYITRPLIPLESSQTRYTLHCSWNPRNLQNSPLGTAQSEKYNTKHIQNKHLFCHSPQRRYPTRDRGTTTFRSRHEPYTVDGPWNPLRSQPQLTRACANHKQRKDWVYSARNV